MKSFKRFVGVLVAIATLALCVSMIVIPADAATIPIINDGEHINFRNGVGTIGVWWWSAADATNTTRRDTLLQFCYDNQVTEIYLCADGMSSAQKATFIRAAGQKGIRVAWLSGDASWINTQSTAKATEYINYQNSADADAKFYALHLDVEPHQLGATAANMQKYAEYTQKVYDLMHSAGQKIEWDVIFWMEGFNVTINGQTKNLLTHLAAVSDTMVIMSYRDTSEAILEVASQEIAAANTSGCKIVLGVETYSEEGNFVSFMEEGRVPLYNELKKVYRSLATTNNTYGYGVAIHFMSQWHDVLPRGTGNVESENPVDVSGIDPLPTNPTVRPTTTTTTPQEGEVVLSKNTSLLSKLTLSGASDVNADANGGFSVSQSGWKAWIMNYTSDVASFTPNAGEDLYLVYDFTVPDDGTAVQINLDNWGQSVSAAIAGPNTGVTDEGNPTIMGGTYKGMLKITKDQLGSSGHFGIAGSGATVRELRLASGRFQATTPTTAPFVPGEYSLGDANLDHDVDMKDVLLIRKKVAHADVTINLITADTNKDGSLDMKDVLLTRKCVASIISLDNVYISG